MEVSDPSGSRLGCRSFSGQKRLWSVLCAALCACDYVSATIATSTLASCAIEAVGRDRNASFVGESFALEGTDVRGALTRELLPCFHHVLLARPLGCWLLHVGFAEIYCNRLPPLRSWSLLALPRTDYFLPKAGKTSTV